MCSSTGTVRSSARDVLDLVSPGLGHALRDEPPRRALSGLAELVPADLLMWDRVELATGVCSRTAALRAPAVVAARAPTLARGTERRGRQARRDAKRDAGVKRLAELAVEVCGGADEREMGEGLGEVAQLTSGRGIELLGVEPER